MNPARFASLLLLTIAGCNESQPQQIEILGSKIDQLDARISALELQIAGEKSARTAELNQRIEELERRARDSSENLIGGLARRIAQLERNSGPPIGAATRPRRNAEQRTAQEEVNLWRNLKTGMSKVEIREVLGDPHSIESQPAWEDWFYTEQAALGPFVRFNSDGELIGWNEPRIDAAPK